MTATSARTGLARSLRSFTWQAALALVLGVAWLALQVVATQMPDVNVPAHAAAGALILVSFGTERLFRARRLRKILREAREVQGWVGVSWPLVADIHFADGSSGRLQMRRVDGSIAAARPGTPVSGLWCASDPGTLLVDRVD